LTLGDLFVDYEDYESQDGYELPTGRSDAANSGRDYSEAMRFLFDAQLGYTVDDFEDGRSSLATLSSTLTEQFTKHERVKPKKTTPAKRKR
jgi:hypothetical protein